MQTSESTQNDFLEEQSRLQALISGIESDIEAIISKNSVLEVENSRLKQELHSMVERIDIYVQELEEIRKHHANTDT